MESELQEITELLVLVIDDKEALIGSLKGDVTATITSNRNLVFIARQFIWMELFTQGIVSRLGPELLNQLNAEDRRLLDSFSG
jgi:Cd2+/Zn2+-exporting ATPase